MHGDPGNSPPHLAAENVPGAVAADVPGMTCAQYVLHSARLGLPGGRAGAVERYQRLFRRGERTQPHLNVSLPPLGRVLASDSAEGPVLKFTQVVAGDGRTLETESVLIPMVGRRAVRTYTLCVSSQIGCAMGCTFCQTAQMGLLRSLTPAEIVAQWFAARHGLLADPAAPVDHDAPITNIVFMGMGEPLDNLDNVLAAIAVLTDHHGASLPVSRITVSTVGRIDGIRRLAAHVRTPGWHRLNLAVSLNAPSDEVRSRIMPINRAMPLAALRAALTEWPIYGGFKFCLEYVLIPGVNDAPEHARQLADFVLGKPPFDGPRLPGLINLIPYNPRDGSPWPAPQEEHVERFVNWILKTGVLAKRRRTKGREQMAACGQLGNPQVHRRGRTAVAVTFAQA